MLGNKARRRVAGNPCSTAVSRSCAVLAARGLSQPRAVSGSRARRLSLLLLPACRSTDGTDATALCRFLRHRLSRHSRRSAAGRACSSYPSATAATAIAAYGGALHVYCCYGPIRKWLQ